MAAGPDPRRLARARAHRRIDRARAPRAAAGRVVGGGLDAARHRARDRRGRGDHRRSPRSSPEAAIDGADVVILAARRSTRSTCSATSAVRAAGSLPPDAVITDVASTKAAIVAPAEDLGLRFVGGHPMAGREATGFAAATPACSGIGRGSSSPAPTTRRGRARVEALAGACGARPLRMDADRARPRSWPRSATCRSSLSAALVEAVAGRRRSGSARLAGGVGLAAGGWHEHDPARARGRRRWARASP